MSEDRASKFAPHEDELVVTPPPGHSREAREAEALMLRLFGERVGAQFESRRTDLGNGSWVELDGVSDDPPIFVEVWLTRDHPAGRSLSRS